MYWDIVEVQPEADHTLALRFADGSAGHVRFDDDFFTGVFAPLRDSQLFVQAFIHQGAVAWPGDIDLAPDVLWEQIRMEQSARDALV